LSLADSSVAPILRAVAAVGRVAPRRLEQQCVLERSGKNDARYRHGLVDTREMWPFYTNPCRLFSVIYGYLCFDSPGYCQRCEMAWSGSHSRATYCLSNCRCDGNSDTCRADCPADSTKPYAPRNASAQGQTQTDRPPPLPKIQAYARHARHAGRRDPFSLSTAGCCAPAFVC
jgi:hypothetical protein